MPASENDVAVLRDSFPKTDQKPQVMQYLDLFLMLAVSAIIKSMFGLCVSLRQDLQGLLHMAKWVFVSHALSPKSRTSAVMNHGCRRD